MKHCITLIISFLLFQEASSQIQVIFRGDDMGFSHTANVACIDSYKEGVVRTVEVMVPGPWFEEAVQLLNEYPDLDGRRARCVPGGCGGRCRPGIPE